jgi:hypothetical protein
LPNPPGWRWSARSSGAQLALGLAFPLCKPLIPKTDWLWEIGFLCRQPVDSVPVRSELAQGCPFFAFAFCSLSIPRALLIPHVRVHPGVERVAAPRGEVVENKRKINSDALRLPRARGAKFTLQANFSSPRHRPESAAGRSGNASRERHRHSTSPAQRGLRNTARRPSHGSRWRNEDRPHYDVRVVCNTGRSGGRTRPGRPSGWRISPRRVSLAQAPRKSVSVDDFRGRWNTVLGELFLLLPDQANGSFQKVNYCRRGPPRHSRNDARRCFDTVLPGSSVHPAILFFFFQDVTGFCVSRKGSTPVP